MLTILKEGFHGTSLHTRVKEAVAAKKKCILLVPEQDALNTEAALTAALPPYASRYFEVSNFSRLANTVFRALGGISYRYATDASSALLMWKTLDALSPFLSSVTVQRESGAVTQMLGAVDELYAAGIGEEDLEAAARRLPEGERLKGKLSDLALILRTYRGEVAHIYGTHAEDLDRLAVLLSDTPFFKDTLFFVDSFTSFTAQEYRILDALIRQTSVTVSLTQTAKTPSLCYEEIKETEKKLSALAECKVTREKGDADILPPAIAHAKEHLFRADKQVVPFDGDDRSLSLWKTKGPFEAADAVASDIAARLREGAMLGDFVIFVRDAKKYRGILDQALKKQSIPCFMSMEKDVFSFAAVRMIRSAYDVLVKGCRRADVLDLLKCGFCAVSAEDVDLFEIYTDFWRISGNAFLSEKPWTMNPAGYTAELSEGDKETLDRVNRVKAALCGHLSVLLNGAKDGDTVEAHAETLYTFLKHLGCEEKLLTLSERERVGGHPDEADALSRLFKVLCDLLDTAAEAVGELCVSREQFADMLTILFSSVSFGQLPTSRDAVTFGSADMLRARGARFVYLLGANEGEFPAFVSGGGAFAESERKTLEEIGLPIELDPLVRASREQFCFLRALCAPSVSATVVSYETDASGSAVHPSAAFTRLEKMFGEARRVSRFEAFTPEAALERSQDDREHETLRRLLGDDARYERYFKSREIPISDTECQIDGDFAASLFGKDIRMSQTRFESYANCPFAYYCRHLLRLSENKSSDFGAADIGTLMHAILENLFGALSADKKTIKTVEKELLPTYIDRVCRAYIASICPEEKKDSPRLLHLFARLERTATLLAEELYDEFAQSDFSPSFFEFPIGRAGAPDPICFDLGDGVEMIFHGVIDRIDTYRHTDGRLYMRVVDYKTGTKSFSVDDVKKGKNLQMLLYLFSLWKSKNPAFAESLSLREGETALPAGVMYMSASPKDIRLDAPEDPDKVKKDAKESLSRSGLTLEDEAIVMAMDKALSGRFVPLSKNKDGSIKWDEQFASLERMGELLSEMEAVVRDIGGGLRRGKAHAEPSKEKMGRGTVCDYCSFKAVCRKK